MKPSTFLIGCTAPIESEVINFLHATGNGAVEFIEAYEEHGPLALVALYAKLCYRSLSLGHNKNISRVRAVEDNIKNLFDVGHGSVFEHVTLNFVTIACSRVFTHELVRHRVGTAFSQTSGRYCTVEDAQLVLPPELDDVMMETDDKRQVCSAAETFDAYLELGKDLVRRVREALDLDNKSFAEKKWWTSALRRIMPNGADNEIGWSCNIRALRHMLVMRTAESAEWEIRIVFNEVAEIIEDRFPLMLYGLTKNEKGEWVPV